MKAPQSWWQSLGVRPEDQDLVTTLGPAYLLLLAGGNLAWLALTGRFISRVGPAQVPYVFILLNLVTMAYFSRGILKKETGPQTGVFSWVAAAVVLDLVLLVPAMRQSSAGIFLGFLFAWLYTIVVEHQFWNFLGTHMPLRLAKRLTPLLQALGTVGRLLGAYLATDPLGWKSTSRLLLMASFFSLFVLPLLLRSLLDLRARAKAEKAREMPAEAAPETPTKPLTFAELQSFSQRSGLVLRLTLLHLCQGVILGCAEYPVVATSKGFFQNEEEITAFFGGFGLATSLLSVVAQFLGTHRLLRTWSLARVFAAMPFFVALCSALAMLSPSFYLAVAVRFAQKLGTRVFTSPAGALTYHCLPARLMGPVRSLSHGLATSFGFILAGVLLLVAPGEEPSLSVVFGVLVLAGGVSVAVAWGMDRAYLETLRGAVEGEGDDRDRWTAFSAAVAFSGGSAVAPVLFKGSDLELRHLVSEALIDRGRRGFESSLERKLTEAPSRLKLEALEKIARAHLPGRVARFLIRELLLETDPAMLRRTLRAAGSLANSKDAAPIAVFLERDDLSDANRIRGAEALLRTATERRTLALAIEILRGGLEHTDPEIRSQVVRVLSRIGLLVFEPALVGALRDPSSEVSSEAIRALERARTPHAPEALEDFAKDLSPEDPRTQEVQDALQSLSDPVTERLVERLGTFGSRERKRLSQLLGAAQGRVLPSIMVRALEIDFAPARAALVRSLGEALEEEYHQAVEACLDPEDGGGLKTLKPVLDFLRREAPPRSHPGYDLVRRSYHRPHLPDLEAAFAEVLRPLEARHDPLDMVEARLEILVFLIGVRQRDLSVAWEALDQIREGDSRQASSAIELLETGAVVSTLGRRLGRCLEIYRERLKEQGTVRASSPTHATMPKPAPKS